MKTLKNIYNNQLGASYQVIDDHEPFHHLMALEINQISFLVNQQELESFVESTYKILNYHASCSCSKDLVNKTVIYQSKQMEIRMLLSYHQLIQLNDLLKGTAFKLSMKDMLSKYKIS
ncbi:hypothetical protein ACXGQW_00270 [Wenyingzhuangia sp. IMCC45533]